MKRMNFRGCIGSKGLVDPVFLSRLVSFSTGEERKEIWIVTKKTGYSCTCRNLWTYH